MTLRPVSPSFLSASSEGTTDVSNCMIIDAEIYGMMPNANRLNRINAPPENILNKPIISTYDISGALLPYAKITALNNYLPLSGGTITSNLTINGILYFGSRVQDFLLYLYGTDYGFGINASTLRYNSATLHKFYSGSTNVFTIDNLGNITTWH